MLRSFPGPLKPKPVLALLIVIIVAIQPAAAVYQSTPIRTSAGSSAEQIGDLTAAGDMAAKEAQPILDLASSGVGHIPYYPSDDGIRPEVPETQVLDPNSSVSVWSLAVVALRDGTVYNDGFSVAVSTNEATGTQIQNLNGFLEAEAGGSALATSLNKPNFRIFNTSEQMYFGWDGAVVGRANALEGESIQLVTARLEAGTTFPR